MKIENAGYTIIKMIKVSDTTFVLGYKPRSKISPYVTWKMDEEAEGTYNFHTGHYGSNKKEMELDLLKRCIRYMIFWDFPEIDLNLTLENFLFE